MAIRNYTYSQYKKKMKSINELIRHLNVYMSLLLYIHLKLDDLILAENNNVCDYSIYHNRKKYLLDNKGNM